MGGVGAQSNSNAAGLVTLTGSGSSTQVTASASLWAFAMFSRYIRPDAVRISTSGSPTNTNVAAFKNVDGSVAVVMINKGSASQSVSLGGVSTSSATAYYMDNSVSSPETLSVTLSGGKVIASLPAYSVVTFVLSTGSTQPTSTTTTKSTTTTTVIKSTMTTTTKTTTSALTSSTGIAQEWGQCGGDGWTGPTTCASPYTCQYQNAWYSQCLQ